MELDWLGYISAQIESEKDINFFSNWKLVQVAWKSLGIDKVVPVERLIKGKFQVSVCTCGK